MGRKRKKATLCIYLNSRILGRLTRESSGAIRFRYEASWLEWEHSIPASLSLPLLDTQYSGARVTAVFENLLPDEVPVRKLVAERLGAEGTDVFSLLSSMGRDCIGALQFLPEGLEPQALVKPTGNPVSDRQIELLLNNLGNAPLGMDRDSEFRISIAGAQGKTALLFHEGQWIEPTGTTPTTHIIKPVIGILPNGLDMSSSVENEYLCLKILEAVGLKVADAEIKAFNNCKALVVKRFDRLWTSDNRLIRLPQEDCCQALSVPPSQKYQQQGGPGIVQIMKLLRSSDEANQDRANFFKANILFWLLGATDGHAKNFSIALAPGGRYQLTPLYDVLTVQLCLDSGQLRHKDMKLAMRVGTSGHYVVKEITGRHFMQTGVEAGLSRTTIKTLFDQIVQNMPAAMRGCFTQLPETFPADLIEAMDRGVTARLSNLEIHD